MILWIGALAAFTTSFPECATMVAGVAEHAPLPALHEEFAALENRFVDPVLCDAPRARSN